MELHAEWKSVKTKDNKNRDYVGVSFIMLKNTNECPNVLLWSQVV